MSFPFDFSNRKRVLFFILSILCGFLDYIICDFVAWVNHLPLFCDTIFIMALSFLAGPWWGVLAGFFYHLIDFCLNRTLELGHWFIICHFLAALTAGYFKIWFIKKNRLKPGTFYKADYSEPCPLPGNEHFGRNHRLYLKQCRSLQGRQQPDRFSYLLMG